MLNLFVFDERESKREEDLPAALDELADDALLWLALRDPTEEEVAAVQEALEISDELAQHLLEQPNRACLVDAGKHLHVTLYVADSEEGEPALCPVQCVLGPNWVVTAHQAEIEVLEEFRERAEGGGQVGSLDSPSFVAAVVEWVVTSYFRAFEAIERELEELDSKVMSDVPKSVADDLARLVELRRSIGTLRRALSPHREVIVALAHPELDLLSTETLGGALRRPRESCDSGSGCGPRSEGVDPRLVRPPRRSNRTANQRCHEGAHARHGDSPTLTLLAGVMGMNFKVGLFDLVWMFWAVIAAMLGIAVLVLSVARTRRWI